MDLKFNLSSYMAHCKIMTLTRVPFAFTMLCSAVRMSHLRN